MRQVRILVFAKAPRPGLAKTRLIPALGADGAAALARRMLATTLDAALGASVGPVELCMTPSPGAPEWAVIDLPDEIECSDQGGGDLGERMGRAAKRTLDQGEAVLLIGTDCAEMSADLLRDAAAQLAAHDACLHPAADGGYLVLGLTRYSSRLFEDIAWSTDSVAAVTKTRIQDLGWSCYTGATLHDIDTPADLAFMRIPPN